MHTRSDIAVPATAYDFDVLPDGLLIGAGESSRERTKDMWLEFWGHMRPHELYELFHHGLSRPIEVSVSINSLGKGRIDVFCQGESLIEMKFSIKDSEVVLESLLGLRGQSGQDRRMMLSNLIEAAYSLRFRRLFRHTSGRDEGYNWTKMGMIPTPEGWEALSLHMASRWDRVIGFLDTQAKLEVFRLIASPEARAVRDILRSDGGRKRFRQGMTVAQYLMENSRWLGYIDLSNRSKVERLLDDLRR